MTAVPQALPVVEKDVTQERVRAYADAAGDHNPIHLDDAFAAQKARKDIKIVVMNQE